MRGSDAGDDFDAGLAQVLLCERVKFARALPPGIRDFERFGRGNPGQQQKSESSDG